MTKTEIITKSKNELRELAKKVSGEAINKALSAARDKIDELAKAANTDPSWETLWKGVDEITRILYTVQSGYPMVPAELAKAAAGMPTVDATTMGVLIPVAIKNLGAGPDVDIRKVAEVYASLSLFEAAVEGAEIPVCFPTSLIKSATPPVEPQRQPNQTPGWTPPGTEAPNAPREPQPTQPKEPVTEVEPITEPQVVAKHAWPMNLASNLRARKQAARAGR